MKLNGTVYTDAEGRPRFLLLPDATAYEIGQPVDMGKGALERWGAEQLFLSSLTPEQREAYERLQKAR